MRADPPRRGKEGSGHQHDGADIRFCHVQQGVHLTGIVSPSACFPNSSLTKDQYFLWYMVFLPLYLPNSSMLRNPRLGITALALWVLTQAAWLQQGYELEFLGKSTFFPGMWMASLAFFLTNCWIVGIIITDGASQRRPRAQKAHAE
jgi:Mannosyltransferase (PIG-M)